MSDLTAFFGQAAFDATSVEPQRDYDVIPLGKYLVLIEKAEIQVTKTNTGHFIYLEMQIIDGQFKGRKVFDRINIENPSQQCVEIGKRCLAALSLAIGVQAISDTNQLLNQTVIAHVKIKNEQNEVRTYSSASSAPVVAPSVAPVASEVPSVSPYGQVATAPAPAYQVPMTDPRTGETIPYPVAPAVASPAAVAAPAGPAPVTSPPAPYPAPAAGGPEAPWRQPPR